MARRNRSNPLALAVLATLYERPMHPYEIAQTLRHRGKHESIRLNYGSLYSVVEGLEKRGLIRSKETLREGRRPERTVYELTDDGAREAVDWLSELIAVPVKEYRQFEAALSLIGILPPEEALGLLRDRIAAVEQHMVIRRAQLNGVAEMGVPRVFLIEEEYAGALDEAELDWLKRLLKDVEDGSLEGVDQWRVWHQTRTKGEA
jgi:DNA-binding PadR family transcriptional regulator